MKDLSNKPAKKFVIYTSKLDLKFGTCAIRLKKIKAEVDAT